MNFLNKTREKIFPMFIFFFLIMFSVSVFANTNYTKIGGSDNLFQLGNGVFNSQISTNDFTRAITEPSLTPVVEDLDNDGSNEILVFGSNAFYIYNFDSSALNLELGYNLPNSDYRTFITFDIDGDGKKEIITANEDSTKNLSIYEYNGSGITLQKDITLHTSTGTDQEVSLGCRAVNECFAVWHDGKGSPTIRAMYFNSTADKGIITVDSETGGSSAFCFPRIRNIAVADYDQDGETEFIFSVKWTGISGSSKDNDDVRIYYMNWNGSTLIKEQTITHEAVYESPESFCDGTTGGGVYITQPLVFDIDGFFPSKLETVIGVMSDSENFKMFSYNSDGSFNDDYPEVLNGNGEIVSNVFKANAFPDTSDSDFCIMGFDASSDVLDVVCASEKTGRTPETVSFKYDSPDYNITPDSLHYYNMVHSGKHSSLTYDGSNLDEIVSTYGILFLNWSDVNCDSLLFGNGFCDLNIIYNNPKGQSALITADYQKVEQEDIILLTSTNLWYLDDGFSNSFGEIDSYSINPCLDSVWKLNSTVGITVQVSDFDSDNVFSEANLYYGTSNSQNGTSVNSSSGTTFSFSFKANQTISNGVLRLSGSDVHNPSEKDIIDLTFTVGNDGVVFGDCSTNADVTTTIEEAVVSEAVVSDSNLVVSAIENLDSASGLNVGTTALWLIFMAVITALMWVNGSQSNPSMTFGAIILEIGFLFIIGIYLGFINVAVLFTMIIISLGIIAFFMRDRIGGA